MGKFKKVCVLLFLVFFGTHSPLLAAERSAALFRFVTAGGVTAKDQATITAATRNAIVNYGFQLLEQKRLASRLKRTDPIIGDFCEERDDACHREVAKKLAVTHLFSGFVERVGERIAVELRLFSAAAEKDNAYKQHLEYYQLSGERSLADVARKVVGKMLSDVGFLQISTNVEGAAIIINGSKRAEYPLKRPLRLQEGTYEVVLRKSGYVDFSGKVDIAIQETSEFQGALKPLPGILNIASEPANAQIMLGETSLGYTPIVDYKILTFGKLPLTISLENFFEFREELEVVPGGEVNRSVKLKPQYGDLLFVTEALDAKVYLDGKFVGNTPLELLEKVPMGKHEVELIHADYLPYKTTIEVLPAVKGRFALEPKPKYAWLSVATNIDRAEVYVNEKFIGFSPVDDFVRLPSGRYNLRVKKHNFFDHEEKIALKPGKTINVTAILKTKLASLNLTSNVEGGKVYLNQQYVGKTPLKVVEDLPYGTYKLLLTKKPYADYTATLNLKPGRINNHFAEMVTTLGKIQVETAVKGVQIFLDKRYVGVTPSDVIGEIKPGGYTLRLEKEGYLPYEEKVVIKGNQLTRITAKLSRVTSTASITSVPASAKVYVDGKFSGVTPLQVSRAVGSYELVVKQKGYRDYKTKLTFIAGKSTKVAATLAAKPFQLSIYANERGAKVELDGVYVGDTPVLGYRGSAFGERLLRISKPGFRTIQKKIKFLPGKKIKFKVRLKPAPSAR